MDVFADSTIRLPQVSDEVISSIVGLTIRPPHASQLGLKYSNNKKSALLGGVRRYLTEMEGSGYWEYFKPADDFLISVTDAQYRQNQWVHLEEGPLLKVRLLISGKLLGRNHDVILSGPQVILQYCSGTSDQGYFIAAGQETKLIVLHCRADILEQRLGIDSESLPSPIARIRAEGFAESSHSFPFFAELLHTAKCILSSRHGISSEVRPAYLESMATTGLCQILAELSNRDLTRHSDWRMHARDINCIHEVRDYLYQHFNQPPTIPELARMVGINQTKLKTGFKQVLGVTIYQYVLERRMDLAAEMLLTQDFDITEIAYRVGYKYPTNFTHAFKKYFGTLPKAWSQRALHS